MEVLKIEGGHQLTGKVRVGGAKNSAVALVAATILSDSKVIIDGIPEISDIISLTRMLEDLNCVVNVVNDEIIVETEEMKYAPLTKDHVQRLRASYYFMGAMLGKYGKAEILVPGGCYLGPRPIDLHMKGFEALGADISFDGGIYTITAEKLIGNKIYLDIASVGATINIMLAAVKAEGRTTIENAAKEPEIIDVATLLNSMGANIRGAGTDTIRIEGVEKLEGCRHTVIPDRIEAGTYIIAAAMMGNGVEIENIIPDHIESLVAKLRESGVHIDVFEESVIVSKCTECTGIDVQTAVYPGFPTDLQQPITSFLTQTKGISTVKDSIFTARFKHTQHLNNMGADIKVLEESCMIAGPSDLNGAKVVATDLRAGAALILAGLVAEGVTEVSDIYHVERGYEKIIEKFTNLGAKIWKETIE